MRLLICGDREWIDQDKIRTKVLELMQDHEIEVVIEGEARGADKIGRLVAEALGIPVLPFPADWDKYHKAAGPIRNQQMIDEGQPTYALAFHSDIAKSRGTKDMVARLKRAGVPGRIVR